MHRHPSAYVRARLALGVLCRDLADLARAAVGDLSTPMEPGERIRAARSLRLRTLGVVDLAVLAELTDGATWDQVAGALGIDLGEAQRRYGALWVDWQEGLSDDDEHIAEATGLDYVTDPRGAAIALDQWWRRHADPWESAEQYAPAGQVLVDGQAAPGDR